MRPAFVALVLATPPALYGQALGRLASVPQRGPFQAHGRAGIAALTAPNAAITADALTADALTADTLTGTAELVQRDTSGHHGSRAHHAAVGAVVGGTVGLVRGVVGDRMWFGPKPERSHFQNFWRIAAPFGALAGALAGTLRQAD